MKLPQRFHPTHWISLLEAVFHSALYCPLCVRAGFGPFQKPPITVPALNSLKNTVTECFSVSWRRGLLFTRGGNGTHMVIFKFPLWLAHCGQGILFSPASYPSLRPFLRCRIIALNQGNWAQTTILRVPCSWRSMRWNQRAPPVAFVLLIIMCAMFYFIHASVNLIYSAALLPFPWTRRRIPEKTENYLSFKCKILDRVPNYNRGTVYWNTMTNALSRYLSVTYFVFNCAELPHHD